MPEPTGDVVADAADHLRSSGQHRTVQIGLSNLLPHEAPAHSAAGEQDDEALKWAALERLPTFERLKTAIISRVLKDGSIVPSEVNVANLTNAERTKLVELALETHDQDNEILLRKMRERMDRVGVDFPTVEVRFDNINIEAGVYVGNRALPTLINYSRNVVDSILVSLRLKPDNRRRFPILHNVRGVLKPGRMTLLLGPPGAGKSTLMKTLAGQMDKDLKFEGNISYNGHEMHEFIPVRTAAYVPQDDIHIGEMTVRETLDFSACVQGAGFRADMGRQLEQRERESGIKPDPTMDAYVKGLRVEGKDAHLITEYVLKVLGLDVCADTLVGNEMIRGISGGQKKRVTTGEMIVGPKQVLFADEISTGLDSSTTFNITKCLRNFTHFQNATVLVALLQPAPETYNLFDDVLLLAEGHVVFHGPLPEIVTFFEAQGFYCPDRKGVADFLQEVTSLKDQEQYWRRDSPYRYVPVAAFSEAFAATKLGQEVDTTLRTPFAKEKGHPMALVPPSQRFGLQRKQLFKALFEREWLLMKRNSFLYIAQTINSAIMALITATVFFRTTLNSHSIVTGNSYLGAIFFALISMLFNGFAEMSLLVMRLPVFYKQRDQYLFPAWAYAIPMWILSIPFSLWISMVWCVLTYYIIGFSPGPDRFFKQWLALFLIHQVAIGMFRNIGGVGRTMVISNTFGAFTLIVLFCLGGFVIAKNDIHPYWIWGFWLSPLAYGENALTNNEFTAPRWQSAVDPVYANYPGQTFGSFILSERSLFQAPYFYWIGVGALAAYVILFNFLLGTVVLRFLDPLGQPQPVISEDSILDRHAARTGEMGGKSRGAGSRASKRASGLGSGLNKFRGSSVRMPSQHMEGGEKDEAAVNAANLVEAGDMSRRGMVLPFEPLSLSFHNVNYYVDMPAEMKVAGSSEDRLQLLRNVSGAFRPKILTALVGVSGAGKTTLMDVLAGRKTGGYIEGEIRVGGYPKVQETFARIAGYCEQNDIHSPQVTVHESLIYSAWLRLPAAIDKETREEFVEEVMELVELDNLRGALVGLPSVTGLSTEQRKRLTIAVELVANPSIIFMDEPTSGLDARAAAIVMRAVRNTVDTGRTVVCTIHQPSIDIFEAFDELLLMKRGGQVIYMGPLGTNSQFMVDYFQSVEGVPTITEGYNPATWMLEVSAPAAAEKLGVDFADVFAKSESNRLNEELIASLKTPPEGHADLHFDSKYSTSLWTQFYACLWKRSRMYWRAPDYNVVRYFFCIVMGLLLGSVFFGLGIKRKQQQNVLNVMGALYTASLFLGWNNAASVQPIIGVERTVMYRERAAGLYAGMPYALAQGVIEIPYVFVQTIVYSSITYALIHFEWTAPKFFWYTLYMFLTLLYFTYYGMMAIAITPNEQLAMVVSAFFFSLWNLFSGFLVTRPNIPAWWRWYYFINPVAWTLYGLVTSQLGDVESTINQPGVTPDQSVRVYIHDYFGYDHSMLGPIVAILFAFVCMFFIVFAYAIQKINFQVR